MSTRVLLFQWSTISKSNFISLNVSCAVHDIAGTLLICESKTPVWTTELNMNKELWYTGNLSFNLNINHKRINQSYNELHIIILNFSLIVKSLHTTNSNMTFFFSFVNNRLGIISLAHALVHVTGFPVVNVHADELSPARIWQHKLCATLSANVNINYRLPIKAYYCICTLRHMRIEIIHGSQNLFWILILVGGY